MPDARDGDYAAGGKKTNVGKILVNTSRNKMLLKGKNLKKLKLSAGSSKKLYSYSFEIDKNLTLPVHRNVSYESDDTSVVTVSDEGIITGVFAGTAYVYAYAQNGLSTRVEVTVK